ncbi:MAG: lysophospholipid acyltransferase family protein [Bacteroidetes bacterium]|nr:lysophospholipid acyltransferase family protein [Bacteroidota bacterium]
MNRIELKRSIVERFDSGFSKKPPAYQKLVLFLLNKLLLLDRINEFLVKNDHLSAKHFIDEIFEELGFSSLISQTDLNRIPCEGKVICVANHPTGALDSLVLLRAVFHVRRDVKIVANDIVMCFENLNEHFLPYNIYDKSVQKKNIKLISEWLDKDHAIIIFPAGTVSRLSWFRIMDSKWRKGAVHFAKKHNSPILPIWIQAKNSVLFYTVSVLSKRISMLLFSYELFNKKNKSFRIKIGDPIPAKVFSSSFINETYQTKILRKHTERVGKNKKIIFLTEKNVSPPADARVIKKELNNADLLGITHNGMRIYLTDQKESPQCVTEIARLRELTFRKVDEGTGKRLDMDKFDSRYSHIIVWNELDLDIVGAYRIVNGANVPNELGKNGFYTSTLFHFSDEFRTNYLPSAIELGRSFVQQKYWNTNALSYLWQGIGAYLYKFPEVKYLFGGVSISSNYSELSKELLVSYFNKWFGGNTGLAFSKQPFTISETKKIECASIFNSANQKDDYRKLKNILKTLGYSVPILYKHYSELCEKGGVSFLDFGFDPDFNNCVDGLILVDVKKIKQEKFEKYVTCGCLNSVVEPV